MANKEVVSFLVGWIEDGFKKHLKEEYDEEWARDNGISLEGTIKKIRVVYDSKRIKYLHYVRDESPLPDVLSRQNYKDFVFSEDESIASLKTYFAFPPFETENQDDKQPRGTPESSGHSNRANRDLTTKFMPINKKLEWGRKCAQLCGIEFKTSSKRKFSVRSSYPGMFKTAYDVNVGIGICKGIIIATSSYDPEVITGVKFVFDKKHKKTQPPKKGIKGTLTAWGKWFYEKSWNIIFLTPRNACIACSPKWLVDILRYIGMLVFMVLFPLYDIGTDVVAAYYYVNNEKAYIITGLILLFILLPHLVLSFVLILEMAWNEGEFDEYPKTLVKLYTSRITPIFILDIFLKILTTPIFAFAILFHFLFSVAWRGILLLGRIFCLVEGVVEDLVGQRHPQDLRVENARDASWAKKLFVELIFETIPQLLTQVAAVLLVVDTSDKLSTIAPVVASLLGTAVNLAHKGLSLLGFMWTTGLTFSNSLRIMFSSALDFFPIFNIYKNSIERVLFQYYDNPMLLELWEPMQRVLKKNKSLKTIVLYLEDERDWLDMCLELLDTVIENDSMELDVVDVCVESFQAWEAKKVAVRIEEFKQKFGELLMKGKTKRLYFLIDSTVDIGIGTLPDPTSRENEREVGGLKWKWQWPPGKTARVEYFIQPAN